MINIEAFISDVVCRATTELYGTSDNIQIQKTRKEFEGDYTVVVFPLLRASRKSPEATATELGEKIVATTPEIRAFNVIKGFLNLSIDTSFWAARFGEIIATEEYGTAPASGRTIMIETRRQTPISHSTSDTSVTTSSVTLWLQSSRLTVTTLSR